MLSLDPGDMDTPLHALAVPDADPATPQAPRTRRASSPTRSQAALAPAGRADRWHGPHDRRRASRSSAPPRARLLVVDARGPHRRRCRAARRRSSAAGRSVVANDAATLPASLPGVHCASGAADRGAARRPALPGADDVREFSRHRLRRRRLPHAHRGPAAAAAAARRATALVLGPLAATVARCSGIRASSRCASTARPTRSGPASRGTAGRSSTRTWPRPLALWDVWTPIAGRAGRVRAALGRLRARLADARRDCARAASRFATLTHAAGISSTGDAGSIARLPFDEPYRIPAATARAIEAAARTRRTHRRRRHDGRARARARGGARRPRARGRGRGDAARRPRAAGCALSRRSCRARTSPAPATTSCCAPLPTTRRWLAPAARSRRAATARTSSATRCCSNAVDAAPTAAQLGLDQPPAQGDQRQLRLVARAELLLDVIQVRADGGGRQIAGSRRSAPRSCRARAG